MNCVAGTVDNAPTASMSAPAAPKASVGCIQRRDQIGQSHKGESYPTNRNRTGQYQSCCSNRWHCRRNRKSSPSRLISTRTDSLAPASKITRSGVRRIVAGQEVVGESERRLSARAERQRELAVVRLRSLAGRNRANSRQPPTSVNSESTSLPRLKESRSTSSANEIPPRWNRKPEKICDPRSTPAFTTPPISVLLMIWSKPTGLFSAPPPPSIR